MWTGTSHRLLYEELCNPSHGEAEIGSFPPLPPRGAPPRRLSGGDGKLGCALPGRAQEGEPHAAQIWRRAGLRLDRPLQRRILVSYPQRSAHFYVLGYWYTDRSLPGGTIKIDRRQSISAVDGRFWPLTID
ncbi:hypothetical protein BHM03_00048484 [Ensete ventricosum]|nr:hypothetical protein BHM03_00048484 [Ensete ventricosum]